MNRPSDRGGPEKVTATANRVVPFSLALRWTGLADGMRERGMKVTCPRCGERDVMMIYPDHAWCWAEGRRFSTVLLLAACWDMEPDDAADAALKRVGYVPPDYASVLLGPPPPEPDPERDDLAEALRIFCRAQSPDWASLQYDDAVARKLAQCLSVLPAVHSEGACRKWLAVSKIAMTRVISAASGIT